MIIKYQRDLYIYKRGKQLFIIDNFAKEEKKTKIIEERALEIDFHY
jgi:hypothetical protein